MEKSQLNFFKLRNAFQKVVPMVLKAFSNFKWKILIWSKEGCHTQTEISSYSGANFFFIILLHSEVPLMTEAMKCHRDKNR